MYSMGAVHLGLALADGAKANLIKSIAGNPLVPASPLPSAFWVLFTGTLLNRLGSVVVPVLSIYLVSQRHVSVEIAGLVVSGYGAGAIFAGLIGGWMADRFGRRPALVSSLILGAIAMLFVGFAEQLPAIFGAIFALGLFGEMYRPAVSAALADLVPEGHRTLAFGYLHWAINLGFSIAAISAGWLVEHNFRLLFVIDAITTLSFAALVLWRLPETQPAQKGQSRAFINPFIALADLRFGGFLIGTFLVVVVFHQFAVALPLDLLSRGISPTKFGMLVAINGLLIVIVQPLFSQRAGRLPKRALMVGGALLTGVGFGLHGLLLSIPGVIVCIVLWTLGEIILSPVSPTIIAEAAGVDQQARYQGAYQIAHGVGAMVAPTAGNFVLGRFGAPALWMGCLFLGCGSAVIYAFIVPKLRRST